MTTTDRTAEHCWHYIKSGGPSGSANDHDQCCKCSGWFYSIGPGAGCQNQSAPCVLERYSVAVPTTARVATVSGEQAYSSASVTKNTKGYSWEAKVYVPAGEEVELPAKLAALEKSLAARYCGEPYDHLAQVLELVLEELDDEARQHSSGAVHLSTGIKAAVRDAVNIATALGVNKG